MVSHIVVQIKNLHISIYPLFVWEHFPETNFHLSHPFLLVKRHFHILKTVICSYLCSVYKDFD